MSNTEVQAEMTTFTNIRKRQSVMKENGLAACWAGKEGALPAEGHEV